MENVYLQPEMLFAKMPRDPDNKRYNAMHDIHDKVHFLTQPQPQSRPWCAQLEHTGTSRMVRRRSCIVSNALQAARALYKALQDPRSCLRSKKNRTLQYQPLHKVSGSTEDWAHGSSLWRLQADATSTATSCEEISKNDFCVIKSCASLPSFGKGSVRLRKDLARRVGH
jgi:hypothetical protein